MTYRGLPARAFAEPRRRPEPRWGPRTRTRARARAPPRASRRACWAGASSRSAASRPSCSLVHARPYVCLPRRRLASRAEADARTCIRPTQAGVLGGRIIAVGGVTPEPQRTRLASVEALDPREGVWRPLAPMSVPRSSERGGGRGGGKWARARAGRGRTGAWACVHVRRADASCPSGREKEGRLQASAPVYGRQRGELG